MKNIYDAITNHRFQYQPTMILPIFSTPTHMEWMVVMGPKKNVLFKKKHILHISFTII